MARIRFTLSVMSAVLLVWSVEGSAQIDNRVDHSSRSSTEVRHDANPGIGTGGYNLQQPGFSAGWRAGAVITGNVTGLEGFHDFSPVLQNNRFRAAVPSSGLYDFNARGVGVEDVLAGRSLAPTYFFNPARTISDSGAIRRGLNLPGSSSPATPFITPEPFAGSHGLATNDPIRPNPVDRRIEQSALLNPGVVNRPLSPTGTVSDSQARAILTSPWFERAATSSIFGPRMPEPAERLRGLQSGGRDRLFGAGGLDSAMADRRSSSSNAALSGNLKVDTAIDVNAVRALAAETAAGPQHVQTQGKQAEMPVSGGGTETESDRGRAITPSGDVEGSGPVPNTRRGRSVAETRRLATAARWSGESTDDAIDSFAREYRDKVNLLLAEGEDAMRRGEYYNAAGKFNQAHTYDPRSALPLLQRGHALAAAGAYVTAIRSLVDGIARHPNIGDFRIDLPSMIEQRDDFDRCRAEIDAQLQRGEDYELRFLLGYLEYYSGLKGAGLRDLRSAAFQAPPGSTIASFPDLVSGVVDSPSEPDE